MKEGVSGRCRGPLAIALLLALILQPFLAMAPIEASAGPRAATFEFVGASGPDEEYDLDTLTYLGLFPLVMTNRGDTAGDASLSVTGVPGGWTWALVEGPSILKDVEPDQANRITIQLAAREPMPGTYAVVVGISPGESKVTIEPKVPFFPALELEAPAQASGDIFNGCNLDVTVRNQANGPDSFTLQVHFPSPDWSFTAEGGSTSPPVAIGKAYVWHVHLSVPRSAEANPAGSSGYQVLFKASSVGDPGESAMNLTSIWVSQFHGLDLKLVQGTYVQDAPGSVLRVDAWLENLGNGQDRVQLSVKAPEGWSHQTPDGEKDMFSFARAFISVYVSPPSSAVAGKYEMSITAAIPGTSSFVTETVTIIVPERNGISFQGPMTRSPPPGPGGAGMFNITVVNNGNHNELLELYPDVLPSGWTADVSPNLVSMLPGGRTSVEVWYQVSEDPMDALVGEHVVGITASSLFSGARASYPMPVSIRASPRMDLFVGIPSKAMNPAIDPDPVYIFILKNAGNVQDVARISVTSPDGHSGWLLPSRSAISVGPGDEGVFHAVAVPSEDALPGDYRYDIAVKSEHGAEASTRVTLTVLEVDVKATGIEARVAGAGWRSSLNSTEGQTLGLVAWLKGLGTDELNTLEVSVFVDDAYRFNVRAVAPPDNRGLTWGVPFDLKLAQGSHKVSIKAVVPGEKNTLDNEAWISVTVLPAPSPVRQRAAVAGLVLTTTVGVFAIAMTNELWKFKVLLMFVVPLYTRLRPETTLDNFTRGRIYGYIEANPGEHYSAIKKALELPNGSLAHHLDMLMKEGFVRFEADGNYKRFYPARMRIPEDGRSKDGEKVTRIQEIILEAVREEPGISQRAISRVLNMAPSTINYHIRVMALRRILRLERGLGRTRCYLGDKAPSEKAGPGAQGALDEGSN